MGAFGGFYGAGQCEEDQKAVLDKIFRAQRSRGKEWGGRFLEETMGMTAGGREKLYILRRPAESLAVALDGEFYNRKELKNLVKAAREIPDDGTDASLAAKLYLLYGPEFVKKINGVFAMAVADPETRRILLYRDRIGAKPLFYAAGQGRICFASLLKGILACPGICPEIDKDGLNEIFSMGPARTPGNGVFRGVQELKPGYVMICSPDGCRTEQYWNLESHPHEASYEKTVETTTELVMDAITRQAESREPVCAFLSGGLDSSLVSAVCAGLLQKNGKRLETFSFDFKDNDRYFQSNDFQPARDQPFVEKMVQYLNTDHHYLECDSKTQANLLRDSVLGADLPVMADIDSSLLYFCRQVAGYNKIALTGECADEIFGGYPWFHKKEMLEADTFPWTRDLAARRILLKEDFLKELDMEAYVQARYEESLAEVPLCPEDSREEARRRNISWLNLKWFMQTLLNRMDRTSTAAGLTARVPFADYRIIEYLWNIPWEMKARDGVVKNLLRESGKGLLPEEIRIRRKSPYPKTYVPHYENLLARRVREILEDSSSPVNLFLNREKTLRFLTSPSDYGRPWYGQLMAAPQMMAYVIQVDIWMREYQVKVKL